MVGTSGQTGGTAADHAAEVDQLFLQYEGRHATADELATLGAELAGGSRSLAAIRADLVGSAEAKLYLGTAIAQVYQQGGGRAASADEIAVWSNEMVIHGATLATVRAAVAADPLGTTYAAAQVTQAYQAVFGRAPSVGELAAWQDRFLAGLAQPTSVAAALQAGVAGVTIDAQVTDAYRTWGGRDPTAAELATWRDTIANGGTLARLKADIIADPLGTAHLNAVVTDAYQQYGGRAPTSAELATWRDTIANGGSLAQIKADIIADPLGQTHLADEITQAYAQWMGRAPTAAELATWQGTFAAGGTLAQLQGDLLADAGVAAYQASQLAALFAANGWGTPSTAAAAALMAGLRDGQSFADAAAAVPHAAMPGAAALAHVYAGYAGAVGRAPSTAEATAALATVQADGTGAAALRAELLAAAEGQAYAAAQVGSVYQQLLGRAPAADELAAWTDQILHAGGTVAQVRLAVLDTAEGHAQGALAITEAYARFLERAPSADELQAGLDGLAQGRTIAGIGMSLFASAEGQVHLSEQITALYAELMPQAATPAQGSAWFDALLDGAGYATMRAELMLDPDSTAVHLTGTLGADRLAVGANPGDVVVAAFDAAVDRLVLPAAFQGTNLLDAAHATQVMSLDGVTPNVLIRLDEHDTILFHGMTLAQLSPADFLFG